MRKKSFLPGINQLSFELYHCNIKKHLKTLPNPTETHTQTHAQIYTHLKHDNNLCLDS